MLLGISDHNKMVLWPGCGSRAEFSLHTKNVRSVWFVVKRRGCCCNLTGGVALIVWFTTNGMRVKNNTIIYVARASNSKRHCGAWSLLLLAATLRSFAHMPLGISDRRLSQRRSALPCQERLTLCLRQHLHFVLFKITWGLQSVKYGIYFLEIVVLSFTASNLKFR